MTGIELTHLEQAVGTAYDDPEHRRHQNHVIVPNGTLVDSTDAAFAGAAAKAVLEQAA